MPQQEACSFFSILGGTVWLGACLNQETKHASVPRMGIFINSFFVTQRVSSRNVAVAGEEIPTPCRCSGRRMGSGHYIAINSP